MSTILDTILAEKRKEVEKLKLARLPICTNERRKPISFKQILRETDDLAVIAEFKRASPSKGDLNLARDPAEQSLHYVHQGAAAISVLTDYPFFKGSYHDLESIRSTVEIPLLCKDFIIDEIQIVTAKEAGADLILLIAAALTQERLKELHQFAIEEELEVLMEVHSEGEVEKAIEAGAEIIGVNNRDLKTFTVDLSVTETLAPSILASGAYLISESGISTKKDVKRIREAGVKGILVGEALMTGIRVETQFASMGIGRFHP